VGLRLSRKVIQPEYLGLMIPGSLVPVVRSALVSQGFPPGTVRDNGTINPAGILAGVYEQVEFRSSGTPTIVMNTRQLAGTGRSEEPNPFLRWLRPTVILRARDGGETVIAPAGPSQDGSVLPLALAVAGLVGFGVVLGRLSSR
jgi:hypothetical protein